MTVWTSHKFRLFIAVDMQLPCSNNGATTSTILRWKKEDAEDKVGWLVGWLVVYFQSHNLYGYIIADYYTHMSS